jgi:hypothetical protein
MTVRTSILAVALIATILTLSVCINACADMTSLMSNASACPKHHGNSQSDCCRHSPDESESAWNLDKQSLSLNVIALAVPASAPIVVMAPPYRIEIPGSIAIFDSSGCRQPSLYTPLRV